MLAIDIVINAGTGLLSNSDALAAFDRAAAEWESHISDSIVVTIDADLADLGDPDVIGQANTKLLQGSYSTIRNQLVADASTENDDAIVAALPSASQASFLLPGGWGLNGDLVGAKAALKAAGFANLDTSFGSSDGQITFNTQFAFDFDNRDGIDPDKMDFETVAKHEIGHTLGFFSQVDVIDALPAGQIAPSVLDLFRFEKGTQFDPATVANFSSFSRSLEPGVEAITDWITAKGSAAAEANMSTGWSTGDGRQASHWKDNNLSGFVVGVMDPTLALGQSLPITDYDLRALDMIGYQISFEPDANSAPVANDDTVVLHKRKGTAEGNVLANDSDPDGDPLTAVLVQQPSSGTLSLNADGSFTYTAGASFAGSDSFSYFATDGDLNSQPATVTISSGGGSSGGGKDKPGGGSGGRPNQGNSRNVAMIGADSDFESLRLVPSSVRWRQSSLPKGTASGDSGGDSISPRMAALALADRDQNEMNAAVDTVFANGDHDSPSTESADLPARYQILVEHLPVPPVAIRDSHPHLFDDAFALASHGEADDILSELLQ